MEEFLRKPIIYVKKSQMDLVEKITKDLPQFECVEEKNKPSVSLVFRNLEDRDTAREVLSKKGIYLRTGKTLVPFRLSGNIEWGVKVPDIEELKDLTFWVWPESLWAPISFTKVYLEGCGKNPEDWKEWWNRKDSKVYQFIGEDNIYFYGIAEMALFMALGKNNPNVNPEDGDLQLPHLIANNHVLFMDKKASSSSAVKPPMAQELLQFYTPEQLRMHFLSLGLDTKSVSFQPKVFAKEQNDGMDPVLKEGNLLTNVFNRIIRSCFYTVQKYYDSIIPEGDISSQIREDANETIEEFEWHMYQHEFHRLTYVLDTYIRNTNKYWVNNIRIADKEVNDELRRQVLIDVFHAVRTITTLLHPIAPIGCDMIREYLGLGEELWSWGNIYKPLSALFSDNCRKLMFLEPKVDFFKKHESQFDEN
jgi:methionyl-tRNA synthetase